MPTDAFPPWMLWTVGGVCVLALAALALARRWTRRPPVVEATLTVQGLPSVTPPAVGAGRTAKAAAFMPAPAPLAAALAADQVEQRAHYHRVGNPVLVLVGDADSHRRPQSAWVM